MTELSGSELLTSQTNILHDFQKGKPLEGKTGVSQIEQKFRSWLTDVSSSAFTELTEVIGIDKTKLNPIKSGEQVVLDQGNKTKMIDHLLHVLGWEKLMNLSPQSAKSIGELETALLAQSLVEAARQDVEVVVTGPLVSLRFKKTKAMKLFNSALSSVNISAGLFLPLPLRVQYKDGARTAELSNSTYINMIDLESEPKLGQNIKSHEEWHTVDAVRRLLYILHKEEIPDLSIDSIIDQSSGKFTARLGNYMYVPEKLQRNLEGLRIRVPELYNFYVGIEPDITSFSSRLLAAQDEAGANIAGFLGNGKTELSDIDIQAIVDQISEKYLPLGAVNLKFLESFTTKDDQGTWIYDRHYMKYFFEDRAAVIGEPDPTREAILNRYSKQTGYFSPREITDPDKYASDMQELIDFFLNPGGVGYETNNRVRGNLQRTIKAFSSLAKLRGDPHMALLEISLLPISHWEIYAKRQQELGQNKQAKLHK